MDGEMNSGRLGAFRTVIEGGADKSFGLTAMNYTLAVSLFISVVGIMLRKNGGRVIMT
jgi:hypothetical protein